MTSGFSEIETWAPILGYEREYEVSSQGSVRRVGKTECLSPIVDRYSRVSLSRLGKVRTTYVHRLVASHFLQNPLGKRCVNHKNGVKTDNRVSNLEWASHLENSKHADEQGLWCHHGERHSLSRLSVSDVEHIRKLLLAKASHSNIAKQFGVSRSAVGHIHAGRRWSRV